MDTNNKKELRKTILQLRNCLTIDELQIKSSTITNKLKDVKSFKQSNFVLCYVDFRNEVMTKELIKYCLEKNKKVAVPLIESRSGKQNRMLASEIHSIDNDLEPGFFGVYEPKKSCIRVIDPNMIDFIVVPGVAFDYDRNRLGYGGGFFDRFMCEVKTNCTKAAVAFDLQVLDKIPADAHDMKVDMIITENRII